MEHVRSMLIEREKEKGAMHQRIKELTDHTSRLEEEARGKLDSHPPMCRSRKEIWTGTLSWDSRGKVR